MDGVQQSNLLHKQSRVCWTLQYTQHIQTETSYALASATLLNSKGNCCFQSPFAMGLSLLHVSPQQSFLQQTSSFFLSSHITKVL